MRRSGVLRGFALAASLSCACGSAMDGPLPDSSHLPGGTPSLGEGTPVAPSLAGHFRIVTGLFSPAQNDPSLSPFRGVVALGDCNADGLLDAFEPLAAKVWVQSPGGMFSALPGPQGNYAATFADVADEGGTSDGRPDLVTGGGDGYVYVVPGLGDCRFGTPRRVAGPFPSGGFEQFFVADVDHDGLADISASTPSATEAPHRLLLARGDGTFEDATPPPVVMPPSFGYATFSTFLDDVDGDGALDSFVMIDNSRSWFSWGGAADAADHPTFAVDDVLTPRFNVTSPMGLAPLDLDRDGRRDYYFSVGAESAFYWNGGGRTLTDIDKYTGVFGVTPYADWASLAFDADLDGWTDLLVLRLVDGAFTGGPIALFMNRHDGTFVDVAASAFGGATLRSAALACGDLQGNGRVSCFARAPEGNVLLENQLDTTGKAWVGLRLSGRISSAEATGAKVSLDGEARPLVLTVDGQAPTYSQHARDLLFPIGDRTSASVTIDWPSGIKQVVGDLAPGTYTTVVEPQAAWVSTRVVRADGKSGVDVTVDPRAIHAGAFTIDKDGPGTWLSEPVAQRDGTFTRRLIAPTAAGSTRIVLTFDGVPLRVRPRVRFTAP